MLTKKWMDIKSLEINAGGKLKTKKPLFNLWSEGLLKEGERNASSFYLLSRVCINRALGWDCLWQQWPWKCILQSFFVLLHPDPLFLQSSPSSPTERTELIARKKCPHFFFMLFCYLLVTCYCWVPFLTWCWFWLCFTVHMSTERELRHDCPCLVSGKLTLPVPICSQKIRKQRTLAKEQGKKASL